MKKALIDKYNLYFTDFDYMNPVSVGNGNFAITIDHTGFHTFKSDYKNIPLSSFSNLVWAGHNINKNLKGKEYFNRNGKQVNYMTIKDDTDLYDELRTNYHKFSLFNIVDSNSKAFNTKIISQTLNLYDGTIESKYLVNGDEYQNTLECYQDSNTIHYFIKGKSINLAISFNEPSVARDGSSGICTNVSLLADEIVIKTSKVTYKMYIKSNGSIELVDGTIYISGNNELDLYFGFDKEKDKKNLNDYWDCLKDVFLENDELNRRMILSLYLMKINTLGDLPPAETGLTCNSWYGKFHLEMHLWHHLGLIYFGAGEYVFKSMQYYLDTYESALKRANEQGYMGARYPKMTDKTGKDSPSHIGCLLVWQAPHVITMLAALKENGFDVSKFNHVVEAVADFIASFFVKDENYYILDKPLIPSQECFPSDVVESPLFETEYLRFGLILASKLLNKEKGLWNNVIKFAIPPKVKDGIYLPDIADLDYYGKYANDHPSVVMAYSFFKSDRISSKYMQNTINKVMESFDLYSMWGWDFPMLAMACNNCGLKSKALEMLLLSTPKNTYLKNGHNPQGEREDLPLYLPGNGGLLLAIMSLNGYVKY